MISALGLRWVWLLLFPSLSQQTSSGAFSVKVQSPVSGLLGSSVSLHCVLANNMDARTLGVRWYRPKMSNTPILFYKNTQIQKSPVDVQYEGRVSLLGDLEKGDVSLRLENLTLADRGDYVCHVNSDNWYDKATVSLRVRAVGSTPVLSMNEAAGEMKFTCQSHGWLPEPSITWTDKDGRDLKHLSKDKFTNDSEGFVDVSSWLIVSPSESEWISCSVGLSDQERKESRIMPHTPTADTESWKVPFTVTLILLLLCISGSTVCLVQHRKALIDYRRNKTQAKETSRTASESKPMYKNCVKDEDKNEASAPAADTDHHILGRDLEQMKQSKVNITIDPDETPESLVHEEKEVKCSVANHSYDSNNSDTDKIFTLCKEKFTSGKHYWEVKVRESLTVQKLSWFVGVASDAAENMYNTPFTPQNEFWVLCYEKEKGIYIRDRAEPLPSDVTNELTAVGVFLDCDNHTVSFYNINTKSHIYTFTNVEPKTSLRPLISPGVRDTYPVWIL